MSETATEDVTLFELLQLAMDGRLAQLHVSLPARVVSYSATKQTVTVTPQLNRAVPDGGGGFVSESLPQLSDVPVIFPRCKQFAITFPLAVGDAGLLVFCERNPGAWRTTGQQCDPGDVGMHTLDGAVFYPGFFDDAAPAATADAVNMIIGSDTDGPSRIEIRPTGGGNLGKNASDGIVTSTDIANIKTAIAGAAVVANDGGAAFKTNLLAAWPGIVGSGQWKAVR